MDKLFNFENPKKLLIYSSIILLFGIILITASILMKMYHVNKNEISFIALISFIVLLMGGLLLGIGGIFIVNYYFIKS